MKTNMDTVQTIIPLQSSLSQESPADQLRLAVRGAIFEAISPLLLIGSLTVGKEKTFNIIVDEMIGMSLVPLSGTSGLRDSEFVVHSSDAAADRDNVLFRARVYVEVTEDNCNPADPDPNPIPTKMKKKANPKRTKLRSVPPGNPPAGYRWLRRGEVVRTSDLIVFSNKSERASFYEGRTVGDGATDLGDCGVKVCGAFCRKFPTRPKSRNYGKVKLGPKSPELPEPVDSVRPNTVNPGAGYRPDEKLISGDSWIYKGHPESLTEALMAINGGNTVSEAHASGYSADHVFIRKIETPASPAPKAPSLDDPRWVTIKEDIEYGEPYTEGDFWVDSGKGVPFIAHRGAGSWTAGTRWLPVAVAAKAPRSPEGTPPAGYRFLVEGETVQPGDCLINRLPGEREFDEDGPITAYGRFDGWTVGRYQNDLTFFPFVRKLPTLTEVVGVRPPVDVGSGYRLLNENDVIRDGDEFWADSDKSWNPFGRRFAGCSILSRGQGVEQRIWRRMRTVSEVNHASLNPGFGYRLLEKGETLQAGDEFCSRYGKKPRWSPTKDAGSVYGVVSPGLTYRRKVDTSAQAADDYAKAKPKSHADVFLDGVTVRVERQEGGDTVISYKSPAWPVARAIRCSPRVLGAIERGLRLTR
jgi:hypothetical protein